MQFYNDDPQADAIGRTQVSMEQIRTIMISNMEQARLPAFSTKSMRSLHFCVIMGVIGVHKGSWPYTGVPSVRKVHLA